MLAELADGQTHSGVVLASALGVSREAISRQIRKLVEDGLPVRAIKGRGYRLEYPVSLLDRKLIINALTKEAANLISELEVYWRIDSTNDVCMTLVGDSSKAGAIVCLAEMQDAGKGRRGRKWHSPLASNLYMSIGLRFSQGIEAIDGLSLAIAVVLARVLKDECGVNNLALKWPNDLLASGKKLGGILIEVAGDPAGHCMVTIGIGINISMNATGDAIDQPWTDIQTEIKRVICRNNLVSTLLNALMPVVVDYEKIRFDCFREEWMQLDALCGKEVKVCYGNGTSLNGIAVGVNSSGAMMLRLNDGLVQEIRSGEVSLRQ